MASKRELQSLGAVARSAAGSARSAHDRDAFISLAQRAEQLAERTGAAPAGGLPIEPTEAMVEAGRKALRASSARFRAGYRAAAAAHVDGDA